MKFRLVRIAAAYPDKNVAYRVETVEPMTEKEAMALMRELGSPYQGLKYADEVVRT